MVHLCLIEGIISSIRCQWDAFMCLYCRWTVSDVEKKAKKKNLCEVRIVREQKWLRRLYSEFGSS